jgi:hypothetical protein
LLQNDLAAEQTSLPQFDPSATMRLAVENTKLATIHRNANNKKMFAIFAPSAEVSREGALYIRARTPDEARCAQGRSRFIIPCALSFKILA